MVSRADADPVLVENRGDVVRVDVAVRERDDAGTVASRARAGAIHGHALDLGEAFDRRRRERLFVLGDAIESDALEIADRRGEPYRPLHVRRARLELVRDLVVRGVVVPDAG